jgi:hypothetical protein
MALQFGDNSTGIAAGSPKVVERSFVRDFIAVVVRGPAKCMQHLLWSGMWCLRAVVVISFRWAFVWGSLVEVDCGIHCFSQKTSGAWESIIIDRAFSVMLWIMRSETPFLW